MELAKLVYDSAHSGGSQGTRGFCSDRTVLFHCRQYCVDVLIHDAGDGMRIVHGQLISGPGNDPVPDLRVEIDGEVHVTDRFGQFSATLLENAGPREMRVRGPSLEFACALPIGHVAGQRSRTGATIVAS